MGRPPLWQSRHKVLYGDDDHGNVVGAGVIGQPQTIGFRHYCIGTCVRGVLEWDRGCERCDGGES